MDVLCSFTKTYVELSTIINVFSLIGFSERMEALEFICIFFEKHAH